MSPAHIAAVIGGRRRPCRAGAAAALRRCLLSLARDQPAAIHRAGHRMGIVLRADTLRVAGDHGVLRRRRLYRGGARRGAGMAAGAADRDRDRRADGGDRRHFHAAAQRPAFCHLHLRPRRTRPSARDLVRGQQDAGARPLRVRRYHPERHLLAAARARGRGVRDRLADRPLAPRFCACASSARTRPSQSIAGSMSRWPR